MNREDIISKFLAVNGWSKAIRTPVQGDASARAYERLSLGDTSAILMNAPFSENHAQYNKTAKLAGSDPQAFICISTALTRRGFSAPRILARDLDEGLLILEDLGANVFAQVLEHNPHEEKHLYSQAVSCLAAIYRSSFSSELNAGLAHWTVRTYDTAALQAEADLMLEWYIPEFAAPLSQAAKQKWDTLWADAFIHLDAHASGLALRDFHAENIFWLPERDGTANIGLIDYQDALFAHPSYDLVSLLEDARRDVDRESIEGLIGQFCAQTGIADDDRFRAAYAVQAAQRNAKILGIFVRLAIRDGKASYLDLIPRVAAHFIQDLNQPVLSEMKVWVGNHTSLLAARSS